MGVRFWGPFFQCAIRFKTLVGWVHDEGFSVINLLGFQLVVLIWFLDLNWGRFQKDNFPQTK
jgi:hypothetical protein